MSCILWSDDIGSGCIEFESKEKAIGRSCLSDSPRWLPRNIFEVFEAKGFWMIRLLTNHDWVIVECHNGAAWQQISSAPILIDQNTMIRVRILKTNFIFKFVFMGHVTCHDASTIDYIWRSNLWNSSSHDPDPEVTELMIPEGDRLVIHRLEWLATYFEKHRWSAIASLLTLASVFVGGMWLSQHLPAKTLPQAETQSK